MQPKKAHIEAMTVVLGSIAAVFLFGCLSVFGYTLFAG